MQQPSKVKDIQSFPLFQRHPESGKFMGITSIPPVNGFGWSAVVVLPPKNQPPNHNCRPIAVYCATTFPSQYTSNPRLPLLRATLWYCLLMF